MRDMTPPSAQDNDAVRIDDLAAEKSSGSIGKRVTRLQRMWLSVRSSPLTRKIIAINLIALVLLFAGIVYLSSSRDALTFQRAASLVTEAELIADVIEVQLPKGAPATLATSNGVDIVQTLGNLDLRRGVEVFVYDRDKTLIANTEGRLPVPQVTEEMEGKTYLTNALSWLWMSVSSRFGETTDEGEIALSEQLKPSIDASFLEGTKFRNQSDALGGVLYTVVTPVLQDGTAVGAVAVVTAAGEIDSLLRGERERVLQMFLVTTIVSVGLSLILASTIANPLADLAAAAEIGRDKNARKMKTGRVRIPDLTDRPDEIGRLSGALRGMISALYNRIDGNEQFAADVAHEIKNPLASLRSAVGTLRMVKREDQREKLLDVIDHDVRRLDRLVSDISDASRLDSELVKEEAERFDVLVTLSNLGQYLGEDAKSKDIDFISDLPSTPVIVHGLEARLAQVFVNLITNAVSFCEDGDAIRMWARKKDHRVLIVVEDTGPGIPEEALLKVFDRFYSQRPDEHFGNNSGLGLAISKQIVEAHGGVIWAENIRPTEADITSEPLGARFVVGLPI